MPEHLGQLTVKIAGTSAVGRSQRFLVLVSVVISVHPVIQRQVLICDLEVIVSHVKPNIFFFLIFSVIIARSSGLITGILNLLFILGIIFFLLLLICYRLMVSKSLQSISERGSPSKLDEFLTCVP